MSNWWLTDVVCKHFCCVSIVPPIAWLSGQETELCLLIIALSSHLETEEPFYISIWSFIRVKETKWILLILFDGRSPAVATFVWVEPPSTMSYDSMALITSFAFFWPGKTRPASTRSRRCRSPPRHCTRPCDQPGWTLGTTCSYPQSPSLTQLIPRMFSDRFWAEV